MSGECGIPSFDWNMDWRMKTILILVGLSVCDGINCNISTDSLPLVVQNSSFLEAACSEACVIDEPTSGSALPENYQDNVGIAFLLVTCAGLSTTLGAAMVFFDSFVQQTNKLVLAGSLGFSGGVMIYVSLVEIYFKSVVSFQSCNCLWESETTPDGPAKIMTTVCFFSGVVFFVLLDWLIHAIHDRASPEKPHNCHEFPSKSSTTTEESCVETVTLGESDEEIGVQSPDIKDLNKGMDDDEETLSKKKLHSMGIMTAIAIGLHNFPEGLATFVAALVDPSVGVALAVAIAIHNIPEGLCVSIPIYYATGSRWKGFWIAFFSGVCEIIGAALGYAFLVTVMGEIAYAILFGFVAGMMVAIVVKELIPTGHKFDPKDRVVTKCIFLGMAVMALSLCLFYI